jgi:hypothetical protein
MAGPLGFDALTQALHRTLDQLPDPRRGKNTTYTVKDAALGAFAVFFTQSPSFLAHQQTLRQAKGISNAQSLFGITQIPCDNQIRTLLDRVPPDRLFPVFTTVTHALLTAGAIKRFHVLNGTVLIALDGTQYFSSKHISCPSCSQKTSATGTVTYSHSAITPVIVAPGKAEVLTLEPEFITPQDGHAKQDCEQEAAKRWVRRQAPLLPFPKVTVMGDDLFCHQPFCALLIEHDWNFILVCKPESHATRYEWIDFIAAGARLGVVRKRHWNGRFGELWTYRFTNEVPLRGEDDALMVNWCELTITHEKSGEQLYHNAFATLHPLTEHTVVEIVAAGRARWKVENENNNVLKTKGYHLEHNFGHGTQHLAAVLVTLNLLAFLFHTVFALLDGKYQMLRAAVGTRQTFFSDIRTLTRYLVFESWDHLLDFMIRQLELVPPPPNTS